MSEPENDEHIANEYSEIFVTLSGMMIGPLKRHLKDENLPIEVKDEGSESEPDN